MNSLRNVTAGFLVLSIAAAICGACASNSTGGTSSGSSGPASGRTGVTTCGAQSCQAGQYCLNLACVPGCGSDDNCAANQTCQKNSGQNVGSCQAAATPAPAKDCPAFIKKCTTCGDSASNCTAACEVVTAECISCVMETSGCSDSCKALCTGK